MISASRAVVSAFCYHAAQVCLCWSVNHEPRPCYHKQQPSLGQQEHQVITGLGDQQEVIQVKFTAERPLLSSRCPTCVDVTNTFSLVSWNILWIGEKGTFGRARRAWFWFAGWKKGWTQFGSIKAQTLGITFSMSLYRGGTDSIAETKSRLARSAANSRYPQSSTPPPVDQAIDRVFSRVAAVRRKV